MNIVACRDREQSLNSMWRAYLAMTLLTDTEKAEKSAAIVGHAFLNARYYDSQRGQFLSEDPVFWSTKQNLENPQSLNSYSYGNGNPITNKDPDGKVGVAAAIPVMYGLGELGAGATIEFWGPPVVVGVGAAAIAIGAYSLTQKYTSGNSSYHASNNPYPGPGMSYEIWQEATQNSYKMDPDFNGNWKGTIGVIAVSIGIINWINSNSSGIEGQGPTNLDLLMAINKWVQDSNSKKGADANTGKNQQQQAIVQKDYISELSYISPTQLHPSSSLPGASANNKGSGSAPPSCGKLCK